MPSVGPNSPASVTTSNANGSISTWSGAVNAASLNGAFASCGLSTGRTLSYYLLLSSYGLTVSEGATIDGIQFDAVVKTSTAANPPTWQTSKILKAGVIGGSNLITGNWTTSTTAVTVTLGGATSLGGQTWLPADIANSGFGIAIATGSDGAVTRNAQVDVITATVYYTEAVEGGGSDVGSDGDRTRQLVIDGIARSLPTAPNGCTRAMIQAEGPLRWRDDGVAPTSGVGMLMPANTMLTLENIADVRLIASGSTTKANVIFMK